LFVAETCKALPKQEEYRLKDQLLRAARGATANISEGYGRFHFKETMQYCRSARGSVYEVLDHFITAKDEGFFSETQLAECRKNVEQCVALLNGYIRYLDSAKRKSNSSDDL